MLSLSMRPLSGKGIKTKLTIEWSRIIFVFKVMGKSVCLVYCQYDSHHFQNVEVSICLENYATNYFELHRGVRQGCRLASYLFIVVANAFNAVVKASIGEKLPKRIYQFTSDLEIVGIKSYCNLTFILIVGVFGFVRIVVV